MQPLYSVDHEMRQSYNRRDEEESASPSEGTPLLHRFPPQEAQRDTATTVIVTTLVTILVMGVVIGIYLLILQNNSENILPPVDTPLQLVSRSQWDPSASGPRLAMSPTQSSQVVVVQTDTEECHSTAECSKLLQKLQANTTSLQLPYNFLLSSNGQTYESLGWHAPSPLFHQYGQSMVLAFIGNFTDTGPSQQQRDEAKNFFAESMSQRYLASHYIIIGKRTAYEPVHLFNFLRTLPQWSEESSDV